jgi:hypothetical protein
VNFAKQVFIKQVSKEDQYNIDAIPGNRPIKWAHCKKTGHTVEKCYKKYPALKPHNSQKSNNNTQKQNMGV